MRGVFMIHAFIPILGSVIEFLANHMIGLLGGFGAVFMTLIIWFSKKYLVPYLKVEKRRRFAEFIAVIADDVTDELVRKYPDQDWIKKIDEAVDKLIEICGINTEVARRAVTAALARK
jgi:hypothetical protein